MQTGCRRVATSDKRRYSLQSRQPLVFRIEVRTVRNTALAADERQELQNTACQRVVLKM